MRDGLLVRTLGDETLVYDRERHVAHCLDATASRVLHLCDGTRSVETIASLLSGEAAGVLSQACGALEGLAAAGLLEPPLTGPQAAAQADDESESSRRALLRRLAAAAAAPVIVSIVAPTPAQAATGACVRAFDCGPANDGKQCDIFDREPPICDGSACCGSAGSGDCGFTSCP